MDWLSVRNSDSIETGGVYFWTSELSIHSVGLGSQAGGSALLLELIDKMAGKNAVVQGARLDRRLLKEPVNDSITNSWTCWRAYVDKGSSKPVFRLSEWQGYEHGRWAYEKNKLTGNADLLVIEDSGIAFRDIDAGWPESLGIGAKPPECILLKLAKYSLGMSSTEKKKSNDGTQNQQYENPLLKRICSQNWGDRTTIITALSDLRACSVKVGASLSWEMLFEEIVDAVYSPECPFYDKETKQLKFARVIVTIGTGGAVVINADSEVLIFDRGGQEDDFSNRHEGEMMGYNTCVMGSLVTNWIENRKDTDWNAATLDGIALARWLDSTGYQVVQTNLDKGKRSKLQFPFDGIVEEYKQRKDRKNDKKNKIWNLGSYETDKGGIRSISNQGKWSILEETVKDREAGCSSASEAVAAVAERAKDIAVRGPLAALPNIPMEIVGNWRSADRQEIEGVRSVNNAIRNYLKEKNPSTPLCIAVFGPPGAGKSFAIKEIAKELGLEKEAQITFNLSQFNSFEELSQVFHQVRDLGLKGKKPLVFWDEFDTPFNDKQLGWLKYFLAPMQDGEFTDHGRVHPIGGGIFVFAGATRHSFSEFCEGSSAEELAAKKPDFISRLKAYIDVKGPNGLPNTIVDKLYIIRRAFLLNSFLELHAKGIKNKDGFQIEPRALEAFLRVNKYKHGARSIETLIKMSNLNGKRKYELSSLPPVQILSMHVNDKDFLSLTKYGHLEMMRIGITGHIGLDPDDLPKIKQGITDVIAVIEKQYPGRSLTVFSPMALGADRLVARMLLEKEGSGLIAVLPLPKDDYINDFGATDDHNLKTIGQKDGKDADDKPIREYKHFKCDNAYNDAEMRQEFRYWLSEKAIEVIELPPTATRNDAYMQVGNFIAENSDLIIAVWDGQAAQGTGGTGDIVKRAIDCGKPILHVWAGNYKENPKKRTKVKHEQLGTFRYMRIPGFGDNWID
jgi:DNA polymerase III delta prime subunit